MNIHCFHFLEICFDLNSVSCAVFLCLVSFHLFKGVCKKFSKTFITYIFYKILHYTKKFLLKNDFFKCF